MRCSFTTMLLAVAGCTGWQPASEVEPTAPDRQVVQERASRTDESPMTNDGAHILGKLETREHEVTIRAGANGTGPSFAVLTIEDGRLVGNLDQAEFARRFPTLFRHFEAAVAGEPRDASVKLILDAGL